MCLTPLHPNSNEQCSWSHPHSSHHVVMQVLKLSRLQNSMKISVADSRVRMSADVSVTNSIPSFRACWWFGSTKTSCFNATKPPEHPEDEDGISPRNAGKLSHPDAAVCSRKFHCRKLFKNPCFGKLVCSHHQCWCCYKHVT